MSTPRTQKTSQKLLKSSSKTRAPSPTRPGRKPSAAIAKGAKHPNINARWFVARIESMGLSQRKFAEKVHLHHVLVHRLLHGNREFSLEEATAFSRVLGVPLDEIILQAGIRGFAEGAGSKDTLTITGWIDGELVVHWEAPRGTKIAPRPESSAKGVQVIRFQTGGTKLDAFDGALAYFQHNAKLNGECLGRQCVVSLKGGEEWLLCVVRRGYQGGTYNLEKLNGELLMENAIVDSASPLMWLKMQ